MAAQKGKDLLLKLDPTGTGTFSTVGALRARSIVFNSQTVDVTDQDSAGQWRELLASAGVRHAQITGSGIFKDQASDQAIQSTFFAGTILSWQIIIPALGTVAGPFLVSSLHYSGKHDSELTYELTLESAGQITFTSF